MTKIQKDNKQHQSDNDRELVVMAMNGDENAFARLLLRYKDSIYFNMLKMVKNKRDAEDLTLEAFGKAFTNLRFYSPEFAFSTWLYRIATNNCIDFLRKKKGIHFSIDNYLEFDSEGNNLKLKSTALNPEEDMILKQRGKILQGYLAKLSPRYRVLIDLRYFNEYSYEEISKALDLPLGTVKAQLFRAREKLYDLIGKTDINES